MTQTPAAPGPSDVEFGRKLAESLLMYPLSPQPGDTMEDHARGLEVVFARKIAEAVATLSHPQPSDAGRRAAEAMREACLEACRLQYSKNGTMAEHDDAVGDCRDAIAALPLSVEPAGESNASWTRIDPILWADHELTGEMLLWRADWVHEDFLPTGIKIGYWQEGEPGEAHFNVADFAPNQDDYFSRCLTDPADWPTHVAPIPGPPAPRSRAVSGSLRRT